MSEVAQDANSAFPEAPKLSPDAQRFQATVRTINKDNRAREILFEATRFKYDPWKLDAKDPYHTETHQALANFRNNCLIDDDIDGHVRGAVARFRRGTAIPDGHSSPLNSDQADNYAFVGKSLADQIKGLNMMNGIPVNEVAKGNLLRKVQGIGSAVDTTENLAAAGSRVEKYIAALGQQQLTPAEAKAVLEAENGYRSKLVGLPPPRMNQQGLEQYMKYAGAKQKIVEVANSAPVASAESGRAIGPESLIDEKEDNYKAFQEFARKHAAEIQARAGPSLTDYIYTHFYGRAAEGAKFSPGAQNTNEALAYMKQRGKWIEDSIKKNPGLNIDYGQGWVFARAAEGSPVSMFLDGKIKDGDIGRLYLNIRPDTAQVAFKQVFEQIGANKLMCDTKIVDANSNYLNADALNRADKIVVYFNKDDQKRALDLVRDIYNRYAKGFETSRPRFTVGVKDANGSEMAGVGFAQEPIDAGKKRISFGGSRSAWLAEAVWEARSKGLTVDNPSFNLEQNLKTSSPRYGINFDHPAFNTGVAGEPKYPELLKGLGTDTGRLAPRAA